MGKKRKRPAREKETRSQKRVRITSEGSRQKNETTHPVISRYYLRVLTLRRYLLEQLPSSSKSRRRRIASLGLQGGDSPREQNIQDLTLLLDSTLVGILREPNQKSDQERQKDFATFTQSQYKSSLTSTDTGPTCPQSEVCSICIIQNRFPNERYCALGLPPGFLHLPWIPTLRGQTYRWETCYA